MSYVQVQRNRDRQGSQKAYVHIARSVWDPAKGRPVQRRLYVGRLDPAGRTVVVSKGFAGRSGQEVELAELRSRVKAGEDVAAWLQTCPEPASEGEDLAAAVSRVEIVGDAHVLLSLAADTGLEAALAESFGRDLTMSLLALALHQTVEGRPPYLAHEWLQERAVPDGMRGRSVSASEVYGMLAGVGADVDGRERFFRGWLAGRGRADALVMDTTSISTYAADLELAEYGHNRDHEALPQVNVCVVADRTSGLPLWYRALPGSIPDVSTLRLSAEMLRDLGVEQFRVSLDRGFYSRANLRDMLEGGLHFVIGVPFSVKQAAGLVQAHRGALASPKRSFPFHGRVMRHVEDDWTVDMDDGTTRSLRAHLFFEGRRREEQVEQLEKRVFALEDKAAAETFRTRAEALTWLGENARFLRKCFRVTGDASRGISVQRKPRAVARLAARMGYTLVLTDSRTATREEVLADYRGRDLVEKLFDSLKNEDGQKRFRSGGDQGVEGRLFVAFLALVLRAELEGRMRRAELLRTTTTAEALAQLRRVKALVTASGKRILLEVSKRSRDLLASLKVPPPA